MFFFKPNLDAYKFANSIWKTVIIQSQCINVWMVVELKSHRDYTWSLASANVHPNEDSVKGGVVFGALAKRDKYSNIFLELEILYLLQLVKKISSNKYEANL